MLDNHIPRWAWGILAGLAAYLVVMYGWVARIYLHSVVVGIPWLISQPGYHLYANVADQHAPGATWLNALLLFIVPDHVLRARLFMILVLLVCMGLVFALARRWWGMLTGLAGTTLFASWTAVIMDRPLYFEVWVGLLALLAVSIWNRVDAPPLHPFLAGILVGLAILCKQHAIALVVVFVIWRTLAGVSRSWFVDLGLFVLGVLIPLVIVGIFFGLQGRLDQAIYWIWTYNITDEYGRQAGRMPELREIILLIIWLLPVPVFAWFTVPDRARWKGADILLLGLLPALLSPAYPRYNRFHLSAAVPIAALIGAGALFHVWQARSRSARFQRWMIDSCILALASGFALSLVLPTWYRIRLGPRLGEYEALVPIGHWLIDNEDAQPGTRVWILPATDPTDNFYAIHGFLPPLFWSPTYPWYLEVPGQIDRIIAGLETDPPIYAILIRRWEHEIAADLLDYLNSHYTPVGSIDAGYEYGTATFYQLNSSP